VTSMGKILDFVHSHKQSIGVLMAFVAYGLRGIGYHNAGDALLTIGTLTGVGVLPNGPNPKT
jgi:hypothetical protein